MATNKHAIIRYRTIDRCLRERNNTWNWQSLAAACSEEILRSVGEEVSLSERTIKGDLAAMRSNEILGYNAPIDYDRKEKSYYYSDPSYALLESPINKNDRRALDQALGVLRQFAGLHDMMGIQTIITKLQHSIDFRDQSVQPVIQFDHPIDAPGQEWLYTLYETIVEKRTVSVLYQPFGREKASYRISPYLLKEYRHRWYLVGYANNKGAMRTLSLDRIRDIKESFDTYFQLEDFDIRHYFDEIVGITLDRSMQLTDIVFEAFGIQVDYFLTRPLHKSQEIIWRKEKVARFKISVIPNYELISELFSYRDNIVVLEPVSIVNELRTVVEKMKSLY